MRRKETGLTLSAVLVIAAAAGFASGGKRTSQANTPNGLGKQRGCRDGGFQDVNRTNPSWVSVDPSDRARPIEGTVRVSKVTSEDYPANHESHDWNFFVKPDAQYEFLNGDANLKFDSQGEKSRKSFDRCIEM